MPSILMGLVSVLGLLWAMNWKINIPVGIIIALFLLMVLGLIFKRVNDLLHFLSGGGTWRPRPLERRVIDSVIGQMPATTADRVRSQLEQPFFVERSNKGRINIFRFYRVDERLKILEASFADKLFKVRLTVEGATDTAHVTFHKGYVFSVEFKNPSRFYAGKQVDIRSVAVGSSKQSYTREIDEAEHGPDPSP